MADLATETKAEPASGDSLVKRAAPQGNAPQGPESQTAEGQKVLAANSALRKIIYTANVDLAVERFDGVPDRVAQLAGEYSGYIARSNLNGLSGSPRHGEWTIRVPAENYERFLRGAAALGEIRHSSSNSQDVSEEFYDVEARIRNKQQEESRLLKLLDTGTGKLEEILTVEREISRVRGEVERMQGRLCVLADLSALTTVNLTVNEITTYEPVVAMTYGARVQRAWHESVRDLLATLASISVYVVGATPWLLALGMPAGLVALLVRWRQRRLAAH